MLYAFFKLHQEIEKMSLIFEIHSFTLQCKRKEMHKNSNKNWWWHNDFDQTL